MPSLKVGKEIRVMILRSVLALKESIEQSRQGIYGLVKRKGVSDPDVVKASQQLEGEIIMLKKFMYDTQSLSKAMSPYHYESKLES